MTVPAQDPVSIHTGNGVAVEFPYSFLVFDESDLRVQINGFDADPSTFTVSGVGSNTGGNVTFTTPPGDGLLVVIALDPVLSRDTNYQFSGDFQSDVVNADFDRPWLALQAQKNAIDRSVKVALGSDISPDDLIAQLTADAANATAAAAAAHDSEVAASASQTAAATAADNAAAAATEAAAPAVESAAASASAAEAAQAAAEAAAAAFDPTKFQGKRIGEIFDWGGPLASIPTGSIQMPTAATDVSRTDYAALFAVYGTMYGAGDGSTTFGLPYAPAGYATVHDPSNASTQTVGQVIAHTHPYTYCKTSGNNGEAGGYFAFYNAGSTNTGSTGGSANLAAGLRIIKCIQVE